MKTLLVAVTPPRFTVKPPAKHVAPLGGTLTLNCSATGDLQPVISWKKQGGQLPAGRSQQINGALVIRRLQLNDSGNYICVATIAGVLKREAVSNTKVQQGRLSKLFIFLISIRDSPYSLTETNFLLDVRHFVMSDVFDGLFCDHTPLSCLIRLVTIAE